MKKFIFSVATVFFVMVAISSCKARPDIGNDISECKGNCTGGGLDSDVACLDRCNCRYTSKQKLNKCNKEYDETMAIK